MKKIYLRTFIAVLLIMCSSAASAEMIFIDGMQYETIKKAKTATLLYANGEGDITIPANFTYEGTTYNVVGITNNAFRNNESITSITIPSSITNIGEYAFYSCTSLKSVTVTNSGSGTTEANSEKSIGNYAFSSCLNLTSITIPDGVTNIGEHAFSMCTSLTSITIPNSVTSIGGYAFYNCRYNLKSITLPDGVTNIGEYAFSGCLGLASITIPSSITNIKDHLFYECGLKSIVIPNNVTSIEYKAFRGCKNLASVVISNGAINIEEDAFADCEALSDIYCLSATTPTTSSKAFYKSYPEYMTLHVPAEAIEEYRKTAPWSDFGSIVALTDKDISLGVNDIESAQLRISADNGFFTINGATEGCVVTVYTASGVAAGKATVTNGTATIETAIQKGETAIVTAGGKSIKVIAQ